MRKFLDIEVSDEQISLIFAFCSKNAVFDHYKVAKIDLRDLVKLIELHEREHGVEHNPYVDPMRSKIENMFQQTCIKNSGIEMSLAQIMKVQSDMNDSVQEMWNKIEEA